MDNRVNVSSFNKQFNVYEKNLVRVANLALEYMKKKNIGVDVFLVGNPRMRKLNKSYLHKDSSTNVLSFEAPSFPIPNTSCKQIGEIYLCPPYINTHDEDIEYMLIHGLLHLFGFLHGVKSDRIVMEIAEKEIAAYISKKKTN